MDAGDMDDFALGGICNSDESLKEAEGWAAEEKICEADDEHHNNYSLCYFHEGLASYMKDGCYLGGHNCKDCKKKFVNEITPGNEETEYRPTERKPVHACSCVKLGLKCEHAYCDPCFIPHLADCGNDPRSPRKRRGAAVYNAVS